MYDPHNERTSPQGDAGFWWTTAAVIGVGAVLALLLGWSRAWFLILPLGVFGLMAFVGVCYGLGALWQRLPWGNR
jgi:hypothetical protein